MCREHGDLPFGLVIHFALERLRLSIRRVRFGGVSGGKHVSIITVSFILTHFPHSNGPVLLADAPPVGLSPLSPRSPLSFPHGSGFLPHARPLTPPTTFVDRLAFSSSFILTPVCGLYPLGGGGLELEKSNSGVGSG